MKKEVDVTKINDIRKSMRKGRPAYFPIRITDGPNNGKLCGHVNEDWGQLTNIQSKEGSLLGWQCRRGHVIGKSESWSFSVAPLSVGQILERVVIPMDGSPPPRVEVVSVTAKMAYVKPINFAGKYGFEATVASRRGISALLRGWRLVKM